MNILKTTITICKVKEKMFIYKIYAKTYKKISQSVISSDLKEDSQKAVIPEPRSPNCKLSIVFCL